VLGDEPSEFAYSTFNGETADARTVLDELHTPPFVGALRLTVVENADEFVSRHRPQLEKLAAKRSPVGVLCLEVATWASNTRLAQAVALAVDCKTPRDHLIPNWASKWAEQRYGKKLEHAAAQWLVELAGGELGVLDQEIAKLATFVGDRPAIDQAAIRTLVAGTRVDSMFAVLEHAMEGKLDAALEHLERLFLAGEAPVKLLAMMAPQLRRFAEAGRAVAAGSDPEAALVAAGTPAFFARKSAVQLRRLGKERLSRLYRRLLQADLDVKGGSALEPRVVIERLLMFLAK
jgi:DNA polymerase-3 subunit delta